MPMDLLVRRRVRLALFGIACLPVALLIAQAKPTDAKASSLATAFVKTHMNVELTEFPLQTWMADNAVVRSASVLRWGQFQSTEKYWPAELCVTVGVTPAFGGRPYDISRKMRFGFMVDDFGDGKAVHLEPPNDTSLECHAATSGTPTPSTSAAGNSPTSAAPAAPSAGALRSAALTKLMKEHPNARGLGVWHLHVPAAIAAATTKQDDTPASCFGWVFAEDGALHFISLDASDGQRHNFNLEAARITELKANFLPIGRYHAFHVNTTEKENINFAELALPDQFIANTKKALNLK
jgi:hypothetical protein